MGDDFTTFWRLLNVVLTVPLLAAMGFSLWQAWADLEKRPEDKLLVFGSMILLFGNAVGSYSAYVQKFPFNAIGACFYSIGGCWLTVSVIVRLHKRRCERKQKQS